MGEPLQIIEGSPVPRVLTIHAPDGRELLRLWIEGDQVRAAYDPADLDQAAVRFLDALERLGG